MAIRYRDATRADTAAIVAFQCAMARETEEMELDAAVCGRGVAAVFDDSSRGRYFVAESGGQIVASLLITFEWSDWRDGAVWWIQSVFVRPDMRKQGIYAALYEHVRRLAAADESVKGIRLYVDRRNTAAQEVYRRLGGDGGHDFGFVWMKG